MYHHTAYGLHFASDLELPELPAVAASDDIDVRVILGTVPDHLEEVVDEGVLFETGPREFLLRIPEVASFLVSHGREIVVEPSPKSTLHEARVFMLGSAFGAMLHQREFLVMHASSYVKNGRAVLIAGDSGAGKSTLLGELLNRGHQMIVDDVCALHTDRAGELQVLPGYPRTRLWADAAAHLAVDTGSLERTRPTLEKFERQLPDAFHDAACELHALIILSKANVETAEAERLSALNSFQAVLAHTYRGRFLRGLEMRDAHFRLATTLARTAPVIRMRRPRKVFDVAATADALDRQLNEL